MNSLILMLAMLGQSPNFDMLGSAETVKSEPAVVREIIREVPVYYMDDVSGQSWHDKDLVVLKDFIKKENAKLKKSVQVGVLADQYFYGEDIHGQTWRAKSPQELNDSITRSNLRQERSPVPSIASYTTQQGVVSDSACVGGSCSTSSAGFARQALPSFSSAAGGCSNGSCSTTSKGLFGRLRN